MLEPMGAEEIVDTPAQAAAQELAPLLVREPLAEFLDGAGLGEGPVEAERVGVEEGGQRLAHQQGRQIERGGLRLGVDDLDGHRANRIPRRGRSRLAVCPPTC